MLILLALQESAEQLQLHLGRRVEVAEAIEKLMELGQRLLVGQADFRDKVGPHKSGSPG